ncbi:MAG: sugar porter family MFS transporter [Bacteroidaceae bacterium]|nr:sugar porter family MFS transporter [Bacteroidaceae bacterium]
MMKDYRFGYVLFLALVAAGGGFLFGYDTAVISGTIGQVTRLYHLDVLQQGWYVGCALVGSIAGVAVAGTLSDRLGRKPAMIVAATLFTLSAVGCALCNTFDQLVVYRIIGGVGIGVASIVCPMYISEIAITQFRGRLVSTYQLAITIGFVAAYLANYLLLQWSQGVVAGQGLWHKVLVDEVYRGMLGLETVPALLFFIVIFLLPESPRWLIVRGQDRRAKSIFGRIYRRQEDAARQVDEVAATLQNKEKSDVGYLFSRGIRTALVAGVCIAILGQFMGVNAVLYYGPKIFEDAGLSSGDSLFYQVLVGMVNMLTTVLALLIIDRVGRKQLVYYGVSGMIVSLLLIAVYFSFGELWHWSSLVMLVFFLLYVFFTAVSISAVVWVLLSEMYPTRVRGLAMSIAGFALWIGTYLVSQLTPWLLANATPTGTFVIFAVMCLPYLFIMWRYIPETAGRSLEDIERHWLRRRK